MLDAREISPVRLHRNADMSLFSKEIANVYAETIEQAISTVVRETLESGGSTVSVIGETLPDSGYMVGGEVEGLQMDASLLTNRPDAVEAALEMYVHRNFKLLTKGNVFLGGWLDKEDDTVWFDVSDKYATEGFALLVARNRGELAIWDIAESKEIRVKE